MKSSNLQLKFKYLFNSPQCILNFWMTVKHKILILENFSLFGTGIKSMLEREEFEVVGQIRQWEELFELLKTVTPDVILLDLLHYNNSFIKSLEKLRNGFPDIPVLLIIDEDFADFFKDFILMGIPGFINGDTSLSELIRAIDIVAGGQEYFSGGILKVLKEMLKSDQVSLPKEINQNILSSREVEVCRLFCNGLTYKEIGATLHISPRTVESHKKNILAKLHIKTTAEIVKYAIQHHLI